MRAIDVASVIAGAGIGGGLRYVLGGWLADRLGTSFPWHTLLVNVSGALLLGFVMALSVERDIVPVAWRLFLGVGILGGYTTFSTLSYESVALIERGLVLNGTLNMLGSAAAGIAATIVGLVLGRLA